MEYSISLRLDLKKILYQNNLNIIYMILIFQGIYNTLDNQP